MAGAVAFDFLVGDGLGDALDLGLQVAFGGACSPGVDGLRFDLEFARFHEDVERAGRFADEFFQRAQTDGEAVLLGDFLRHCEVVARLRFMGVGDGGGADFEVALGGRQLFGDGRFLRIDEGDVVLRLQHVEIGLCDAQDQVLCRYLQLHLGDLDLLLGLLVLHQILFTEQRLRGVH